ncbi:DUF300-domain-containing protein [Polychaeton citri CBS 116435]|uniref:DUF300-domain-containing protein n=1 Tax=Polychaeton citri CBS 116435 TaxID=1314669 RepID=A0A9P4UJK5_9PEZI|nr:DUF300-domain-containing protein [Polychaeton citri CBS 116435]
MPVCNSTRAEEDIHEIALYHGVTFHHFGLAIAAVFGLIAVVISLFLMVQHALHYSRPTEQKHIIRILFMIPIYAVVSYLSFLFYQHAVYFEVLRDCYEAFAIASFFTLLCNYIAPTLHDQKEYFRGIQPQNWFWGVFGLQYLTGGQDKGIFRRPRSGLTWFNVVWIGVFQYCLIRVLFTIVSVITEANDLYCESSLSPAFAHIWVTAFEAISVTIAMFCLIQFYLQLKDDLAEHRPFFKVLCIKLVIFLSFWQTIIISLLSSSKGPLQPTSKLNYQDIKVGIPAVLLCIEMAIFAVMHFFSFSWKPYNIKRFSTDPTLAPGAGYSGSLPTKYQGGKFGLKALADAFNPWDIIKASARGFRWLFVGARHRHTDSSYRQSSKLGPTSGTVAGQSYVPGHSAGQSTELQGGSRSHDEDRAGLLGHSAHPAGYTQRRSSFDDDDDDAFAMPTNSTPDLGLASPPRLHVNPLSEPSEEQRLKDMELGYHSVASAPSEMHPALRGEQASPGYDHDWNFVGGATRNDSGDEGALHPGFSNTGHR